MKKRLVLTVAALAVLLSCGIALTAEKEKAKGKERQQKITAEEKAWKEKLAAMTPEERRVAVAKKALATELAPWREVRKVAESEKATKTLAAIDKIIAAKELELKKKLEAPEKEKAGAAKKDGEGTKTGGRKGRGKAKAETE